MAATVISSRLLFLKCPRFRCNLRFKHRKSENTEKLVSWEPRQTFRYSDERKIPYEDPFQEKVPQYFTSFEKSSSEWKYVQRLMPPLLIPQPPKHSEYPTPSGWQPPSEIPPDLPYYIRRTKNHLLPVYFDIKYGGTKKITSVRYIDGDIWAFEEDLKAHLEEKFKRKIATQVLEPRRSLKLKGDYLEDVKEWLMNKGF